MMRINRRTDYAIRVVLTLAKRPGRVRLSTQSVQDMVLAPRAFLQRIIADLARAGLINTYPGPKGGIELAQPAETLNLRHVWEAIEGPLLISDCVEQPEDCPLRPECPVSCHWARLQRLILQEMERVSFHQLATEAGGMVSQGRGSQGSNAQGEKI